MSDTKTKLKTNDKPKYTIPDQLTIRLGGTEASFRVKDLKRIPFFNVMVSEPWNMSFDPTKPMTPLKDKFNEEDDDVPFDCDDLKVLIRCVKRKEIPTDVKPELDTLQRLILCADYFGDTVVCKESIKKYLKCKPNGITVTQRRKMAENADIGVLKDAFTEYDKELQLRVHALKSEIAPKWWKMEQIRKLLLDSQTACMLLSAMLREFTLDDTDPNVLFIRVGNLSYLEDYLTLWKKRKYIKNDGNNNGQSIQWLEILKNMAHILSQNPKIRRVIEAPQKVVDSLDTMLSDMVADIVSKRWNNRENLNEIMAAVFRLNGETKYTFYTNIEGHLGKLLKHFKTHEIEAFTALVIGKFEEYIKEFWAHINDTPEAANKRKQGSKSFYALVALLISKCSPKFIVNHENADAWFEILMRSGNNDCENILINDTINTKLQSMSTQDKFEFAMYLSQFVVFEWDELNHGKIDAITTFMADYAGISWQVLPSADSE